MLQIESPPPSRCSTLIDEALMRREIASAGEHGYVMVNQGHKVNTGAERGLIDREGQMWAALSTHASRMAIEGMREKYLSALYKAQTLLRQS